VAAQLGDALYSQGRFEEAAQYAHVSEETAALGDYASQALWRSVRAKAIARSGRLDDAERLAREAVVIGEDTDHIDFRGDTFMALAEVLRLAERSNEALPAVEEALRLYEQKGNVVSAGKARALLDDVQKRSQP
jgi:tetratricopeptide (TPR) repeat protein